jgi:hypothetical protein
MRVATAFPCHHEDFDAGDDRDDGWSSLEGISGTLAPLEERSWAERNACEPVVPTVTIVLLPQSIGKWA